MSNALTTDRTTITVGDAIIPADYNNGRADIHSTAEGFWDDGTPDLPSSMRVKGVHWSDPTSKALRLFRQTSTGADSRAMSSPIRPLWHYADQSGEPATDARVVEGDLLLWDDGTNDRFLKARSSSGWYGLGVRADYRTAATSGAGAKQHSDRVTLRASSWDGSTAKYREWRARAYVVTDASGADAWDYRLSRFAEGGAERDVLQLSRNGELRLQGNADAAGIVLSSSLDGTGTVTGQFGYITSTSTDPDQAACVFVHGQATRRAIWRFKNPTTGYLGFDAETITLRPYEQATSGDPIINSPSWTLRGSYWNGSMFVESGVYGQMIMTATDPAGYFRQGFNFGSGTLDLYSDGNAWLRGDVDTNLWLTQHTDADSGDKDRDSLALVLRATSWDGAAAAERGFAQIATITSPADASDTYELDWIDINTSAVVMQLDSAGNLGVGGSPATRFHSAETKTITGAVTDGYAAGFTLAPTYTAATAQTVTRHNYLDVKNVTLSGAGPAALTDACFARFDAAAGTHKAVASGTTKTTPGGVDAWLLYNVNGTIYYGPLYTSKTA